MPDTAPHKSNLLSLKIYIVSWVGTPADAVVIAFVALVKSRVTQLANCLCNIEKGIIINKRRRIRLGCLRGLVKFISLLDIQLYIACYSTNVAYPLDAMEVRGDVFCDATRAEMMDR
jgi:hypothetical protein